MIITGYTDRSISDQTGNFSFSIDISLDNTTGACSFGLSGASDTLDFTCKSGKVYDPEGRFFAGYKADSQFNISCSAADNDYSYRLDQKMTCQIGSKPTGTYDHFYINPTDVTATVDVSVSGLLPNYTIDNVYEYITGDAISGTIVNNNDAIKFKVFGSKLDYDYGMFTLSGFPSGIITGTGTYYITCSATDTTERTLPLTVNTNFGNITKLIKVSGFADGIQYYYLTLQNQSAITGTASGTFNLLYGNPRNAYLDVILTYVSGAETIQGLVTGSGLFTQQMTYLITGSGDVSQPVSGTMTGTLSGIQVTGYGSGNFEHILLATGIATGYATGHVITYVTGYRYYPIRTYIEDSKSGDVTGACLFSKYYSQIGTGLNYWDTSGNGLTRNGLDDHKKQWETLKDKYYMITGFDNTGDQTTGLCNGYFGSVCYATGTFTHDYTITGTGYGTGIGYTGTESEGIITGSATVTINEGSGYHIIEGMQVTGALVGTIQKYRFISTPIMTSNTEPYGICTGYGVDFPYQTSDDVYCVFQQDDRNSTPFYFLALLAASGSFIQYYFGPGSGKNITSYELRINPPYMPKTWNLEASNDNITWDILHTKSGDLTQLNQYKAAAAAVTGNYTTYKFYLDNTGAYEYYRMIITSSGCEHHTFATWYSIPAAQIFRFDLKESIDTVGDGIYTGTLQGIITGTGYFTKSYSGYLYDVIQGTGYAPASGLIQHYYNSPSTTFSNYYANGGIAIVPTGIPDTLSYHTGNVLSGVISGIIDRSTLAFDNPDYLVTTKQYPLYGDVTYDQLLTVKRKTLQNEYFHNTSLNLGETFTYTSGLGIQRGITDIINTINNGTQYHWCIAQCINERDILLKYMLAGEIGRYYPIYATVVPWLSTSLHLWSGESKYLMPCNVQNIPSHVDTDIFAGLTTIDNTGENLSGRCWPKLYAITNFDFSSGKIISGEMTGIYDKTFQNTWDLKTGLLVDDAVSYKDNNWTGISGLSYNNSGLINMPSLGKNGTLKLIIEHNSIAGTSTDAATLTITGSTYVMQSYPTGIIYTLSGIN